MVGLGLSIIYILIAVIGPLLITSDPTSINPTVRFQNPSLEHLFGTDRYGRDVLIRTIYGARISLRVAVIVTISSTIVGVFLGLLAGFYGGKVDEAIMRVIDVMFAFPSILLALVIVAILGPGLNRAILALSIAFVPPMVRVTRGSALSVREEEYVLAAISYGESSFGIMRRDMLPNLLSAVIVQATITFAYSIIAEAGLSYLALSASPPTPTWGAIISEGQNTIELAPWVIMFPSLSILVTVLGLTFFGIGLRDALDPKTDTDEKGGAI
jgi:peptide/nickel transport system permease protein